MLVGLLTRHINLHYMLHKMRRAENPLCMKCGAEMEMSEHVHILCEILMLEKIRMQSSDFAWMDPDHIKEVTLSSIVTFSKTVDCCIAPYKFK